MSCLRPASKKERGIFRQKFGLIIEPGCPPPDPNLSLEENCAKGHRFCFEDELKEQEGEVY